MLLYIKKRILSIVEMFWGAEGVQNAECRGQRAEGRGQSAEGRGQRAEGRGQSAEGRVVVNS